MPPWFVPTCAAVGVGYGVSALGEYEDPFADMRRPNLSSADNAGTGGVSEVGEISEHETKTPRAVTHDVLAEHVGGLQLVNNGCELRPEPARVFGAASAASVALGLAGVAARNDVDHRAWF